MAPPLRIGFVSAELAPFAKRGGLGDVAAALTRHLAAEGHDVRTFVPLYGAGRWPEGLVTLSAARRMPVTLGARTFAVTARTAALPGVGGADAGPRVVLLDCPEVFGGEVYEGDERDALRFAVFCRAVLETCQRLAWAPQVFHVHDWHSALLPLYLRSVYAWDRLFDGAGILLTLHNIGFQGVVGSGRLAELGLDGAAPLLPADDLAAGRLNLLKAAILQADLLSTVSPTHAREITTPEGGAGLDGVLRERADRLSGIVNGIDTDEWDPATDPHLPAHFSAGDLLGKTVCRRELAAELGLDYEPAAPVAGIVSRLTWQKGFDLAFETLPALLAASDLRLAVLGTGEPRYETFFAGLEHAFPGRVAFRRAFSEPLAHRIEAGCDLFLMPSRYEPCGLNQMYSQRYGTLPVVRRTGGLADTVEPFDPSCPEAGGTGFVFDHFTAEGFRWALDTALVAWRDRPLWRRLVERAMGRDFSWHRRGVEYVALYRRLAGEAAGSGDTGSRGGGDVR